VSHVDDAQEAEGDGQAERAKQKHAAQAQAVEEITDEAHQHLPRVDGLQRQARGVARFFVGFGRLVFETADHAFEVGFERGVGGRRDGRERGQLELLVVAVQVDLRQRQPELGANVAVLLFGDGRAHQRRELVVAALG
jgi:hypothetical protein